MFHYNALLREDVVTEALGDCAGSFEQLGSAHWRFGPFDSPDLGVEVRIEDDWLVLASPLEVRREKPSSPILWKVLEENGRLPGGVKLARLVGDKRLVARVELPLDPDVDIRTRVQEACAGFKEAYAGSQEAGSGFDEAPAGCRGTSDGLDETGAGSDEASAGCQKAGAALNPAETVDRQREDQVLGEQGIGDEGIEKQGLQKQGLETPGLLKTCEESGWTCNEQPSGRLVIDLDVPGWFHQAVVEIEASGRVTISTELSSCDGNTPSKCRQALGLLLLQACGVVRMARAAAHVSNGQTTARFEVAFDSSPSATEMEHGLAALSMACRLCAQEADLIGSDERIAREYLARWGRVSVLTAREERGNGRLPKDGTRQKEEDDGTGRNRYDHEREHNCQ